MPTKVLKLKSLFEMLHEMKPNLSHLRSFGCLCFVATSVVGRDKFMSRSQACVFIGYPYNQKAYKVMNIETKRIFVTRDIKFFEHIFPLHSLHS